MRSILLALLFLPALALAGFEEAIEVYRSGDYAGALKQFKQLAEQGDAGAAYYVGEIYHRGYGVPVDHAEAAKWYRRAAAKGDPLSQYHLGMMAARGQGMEKDATRAHLWLSLSARNAANVRDVAYTQREIQKLERSMTPEQIAQAKKLAQEWKPEK